MRGAYHGTKSYGLTEKESIAALAVLLERAPRGLMTAKILGVSLVLMGLLRGIGLKP
jgi:hypothetical protein